MARMKNPYGGCFRFVPFRRMAKEKKCPVDRGKLLIALECCTKGFAVVPCVCDKFCPYGHDADCCDTVRVNALAYICYLEEQLGVNGL